MIKLNKSRPTKGKHSFSVIVVVAMLISLSSVTIFVTHSIPRDSPSPATDPEPSSVNPIFNIPEVKVVTSLPELKSPPAQVAVAHPLPPPPHSPPVPPVTVIPFTPKKNLIVSQNPKQPFRLHFMHIPKCGGTSMTAVLREVMCDAAPDDMKDCCTNPGFCDTRAMRRCEAIKGCTNHFANRPFIFKPEVPSITVMRNPVSRLVSAWFYRCHSPNSDCFQVRPEFKLIKQKKKPKVVFDEYLEMREYNNILTRMLGAGSFPYKDVNITEQIFQDAVDALDHMFFVGLQEAYDLSVELLLRELGSKVQPKVKKERQDMSKRLMQSKLDVTSNSSLMARAAEVNAYDIRLYDKAREKFCLTLSKHADLMAKLDTKKVRC